jgi:hypothetical protein
VDREQEDLKKADLTDAMQGVQEFHPPSNLAARQFVGRTAGVLSLLFAGYFALWAIGSLKEWLVDGVGRKRARALQSCGEVALLILLALWCFWRSRPRVRT